MALRADLDVQLRLRDAGGRRLGAVAGALAGAGLVLVTEDDDLLALSVTHDLAGDLGLRRVLHRLAIRQEQNVAEGHFLPRLAFQRGHGEERSLFDPVLLPARADDCVHGQGPSVQKKSPCPPDTTYEKYTGRPTTGRPPST